MEIRAKGGGVVFNEGVVTTVKTPCFTLETMQRYGERRGKGVSVCWINVIRLRYGEVGMENGLRGGGGRSSFISCNTFPFLTLRPTLWRC